MPMILVRLNSPANCCEAKTDLRMDRRLCGLRVGRRDENDLPKRCLGVTRKKKRKEREREENKAGYADTRAISNRLRVG